MADGAQYNTILSVTSSGAVSASFTYGGVAFDATNLLIINDGTSNVFIDVTGAVATSSAGYLMKTLQSLPLQAPWHMMGWSSISAFCTAGSAGTVRVLALR